MFDGSILEWACGRGNLQMNLELALAETFNAGKRCRIIHRKGINAEKSNSIVLVKRLGQPVGVIPLSKSQELHINANAEMNGKCCKPSFQKQPRRR
jgi:predicted RNA-binding protein with PUA domain